MPSTKADIFDTKAEDKKFRERPFHALETVVCFSNRIVIYNTEIAIEYQGDTDNFLRGIFLSIQWIRVQNVSD